MKKLLIFSIPVLFLFMACNNTKQEPAPTVTTESTPAPPDTSHTGTGGASAEVYVDGMGTPVPGATVTVTDSKKAVAGKATTDAKGMYTVPGLKAGTAYVYTSTMEGYNDKVVEATYDGTDKSFPPLPMTKK